MDGALHGVGMDTLFTCFARRRKKFFLFLFGGKKSVLMQSLCCAFTGIAWWINGGLSVDVGVGR